MDDGQLKWHKSSYSGSGGGNCVEMAVGPGAVRVRDSKVRAGAALRLAPEPWAVFLAFVAEAEGRRVG